MRKFGENNRGSLTAFRDDNKFLGLREDHCKCGSYIPQGLKWLRKN